MSGVSESFGMQQARLVFSDKPIDGKEAYQIQKNFPNECSLVFAEWKAREGVGKGSASASRISSIVNKYITICTHNPTKTIAASLITASGLAVAVFFCRKLPWH